MTVPPPNMRILPRPNSSRNPRPQRLRQPASSSRLSSPASSGPSQIISSTLTASMSSPAILPSMSQCQGPPQLPNPQQASAFGQHSSQKAPEPKLKILKRPEKGNGNSDSALPSEKNKKAPPKTLKQREEDYAQARLRILGSTGSDNEDDCITLGNGDASQQHRSESSKSAKTAAMQPSHILRCPKGPDGSNGFQRNNTQS